jgi:phosphoglycerate kinase
MFTKKTINDIDLDGKTVLLREDYNVPVENGKITSDYRIKQSLPTIRALLKHNVRLIVCSHLGRPSGPEDTAKSLLPVAKQLSELLAKPVAFATDCVGPLAESAAAKLQPGEILLLENLRFHPEEKANDDGFAKQLAALAGPDGVFVQDGFGVVHRPHASTVAITHHLPAVAGLLLTQEIETINGVIEQPERPLVVIIGGAKIADKIDILNRFTKIADTVAIGGAMANTFLAAQGVDVANSLYDEDKVKDAQTILDKAAAKTAKRKFNFGIPSDGVVATAIEGDAKTRIVEFGKDQLEPEENILDIGPASAERIVELVRTARTVIWNGTMGVTEVSGRAGAVGPFAGGTEKVIEALISDSGHKPRTLVGGGDTAGYLETRRLVDQFWYVSTGGGASLDLMGGHPLPGVEALLDK